MFLFPDGDDYRVWGVRNFQSCWSDGKRFSLFGCDNEVD